MSTLRTRYASNSNKNPSASGSTEKPDPYQQVTDLIIGHLENGVVPWRCPWSRDVGKPRNFHTGKCYQGMNVVLLGMRFAASPWWMTYRQAQERGGHVRKGEHGALVCKYGTFERKADATGDQAGDETVKGMFLRGFIVFNASQIEGIEFPEITAAPRLPDAARIAGAEAIASAMPQRPVIREGNGTRACYRPTVDEIEMPAFASFESAETYYLTLYHEMSHATGHPSRLDRCSLKAQDRFGGKVYSQEELVAEMGAAFVGMEADIVSDRHERNAAYLNSWLQMLKVKDHRRWLVQAASQASKAADFILGRNDEADEAESTPQIGEEVES